MCGMDTITPQHDIRPAYRSAIDVLDVAILELWDRIDDLLQAKRHLQGLDVDDEAAGAPGPAPSIAEAGTPPAALVDEPSSSTATVTPAAVAVELPSSSPAAETLPVAVAVELVICEDCGNAYHPNGIGPHRRRHRDRGDLPVVGNVAKFDPDRARAAAAQAS